MSPWKWAVTVLHKNMLDKLLPEDRAFYYREEYLDILEDDFLRICRKEGVPVHNVRYSDWLDDNDAPLPQTLTLVHLGECYSVGLSSEKVDFKDLIHLEKRSLAVIQKKLDASKCFPDKSLLGFKMVRGHMNFVLKDRYDGVVSYIPWITLTKDSQAEIKSAIGDVVRIPPTLRSDVRLNELRNGSVLDAFRYLMRETDLRGRRKWPSVEFDFVDVLSVFPFYANSRFNGNVEPNVKLLYVDEDSDNGHCLSACLLLSDGGGGMTDGVYLNEHLAASIVKAIPEHGIRDDILSCVDKKNLSAKSSSGSLSINIKNLDDSSTLIENIDADVDFTVLFSTKLEKPSSVRQFEDRVREEAGSSLIVVDDALEARYRFWLRGSIDSFVESLPEEFLHGTPCSLNIVDVCAGLPAAEEKSDSYEAQAFYFLSEIQRRGVVVDKIVCSGNAGFEMGFAKAAMDYGIGVKVNVPLSRAAKVAKDLKDFRQRKPSANIVKKNYGLNI